MEQPPTPPPPSKWPPPPPGPTPPPEPTLPGGEPGAAGPGRAVAQGPDLAIVVAGAIFFVATLLPWYRVTFGVVSSSSSAWGSGGLGVLSGLFGIGALVVAAMSAGGSKGLSAQTSGLLTFVLSAGAFFFALLRLIIRPPGSRAAEVLSRGLFHVNRGFGLFIAILAAIVMTVAAYFKYRENAV